MLLDIAWQFIGVIAIWVLGGLIVLYAGYTIVLQVMKRDISTTQYPTLDHLSGKPQAGMIFLAFDLPGSTTARLEVLNQKDEVVALLNDQHQVAGRYTAQFDSAQVPNGKYKYRLTTPQRTLTKYFTVRNAVS